MPDVVPVDKEPMRVNGDETIIVAPIRIKFRNDLDYLLGAASMKHQLRDAESIAFALPDLGDGRGFNPPSMG